MSRRLKMLALGMAVLLSANLAACGQCTDGSSQPASLSSQVSDIDEAAGTVTITDSTGKTAEIPEGAKVISLYGSYAEAWLLAGGQLTGVTQDAIDERGLDVGGAEIVGTVKEPNAETIIALEPDLVLISSDIAAQQDMLPLLEQTGLTCLSYRVDTFQEYAAMMEEFCKATGRQDLFEKNVTQVADEIEYARKQYTFTDDPPKVLLMRAFSTGIKAKTNDELAGAILEDLGCHNIANDHPSMLEDLSLEEIISVQPDFIFVTTMGDEDKALSYLDSQIMENPAWAELDAVKERHYTVLPKELFHYKPNARWGESYAYLGALLHDKD